MTSSILKLSPVCYITKPNDFINYLSRKELTMPRLSVDAQLAKIKNRYRSGKERRRAKEQG
jgi:hypothetical protein